MMRRVCVVIPTYHRECDAARQARRFARMRSVARVLVIDQADTLSADEHFSGVLNEEPKVRLIVQPNLGGSGGYARGMLEALAFPGEAVLLSDDDAVLSEEALETMVLYQQAAPRPTIMGTGMISAEDPHLLVSQAETVWPRDFMWGPADGLAEPLDLTEPAEVQDDVLRLRTQPNYTGWWGTLLPPGAVTELGLPAPYFLKWDDAEYGLRATQRGYDTVVLPQARVTHPTWGAYKTQMDWTARILHRNRLATAAAYRAGEGVIVSSLAHQLKHILAGHYLTATLWAAGIDQFLSGPQQWLGSDLTHARSDGQAIAERWNHRYSSPEQPPTATHCAPLPLRRAVVRAVTGLLDARLRRRVVLHVGVSEVSWRTTLGADLVVMTHPDGSNAGTLTANTATARALLARTVNQHWHMLRRWRVLRSMYGRALPTVTTPEAWRLMIARAEAEQRPGD